MHFKIYMIHDNVAADMLGRYLMTHKHDAPAVREFTEAVLATPRARANAKDYDLIQIGQVDGTDVTGTWRVVITGEALAASQPQEDSK